MIPHAHAATQTRAAAPIASADRSRRIRGPGSARTTGGTRRSRRRASRRSMRPASARLPYARPPAAGRGAQGHDREPGVRDAVLQPVWREGGPGQDRLGGQREQDRHVERDRRPQSQSEVSTRRQRWPRTEAGTSASRARARRRRTRRRYFRPRRSCSRGRVAADDREDQRHEEREEDEEAEVTGHRTLTSARAGRRRHRAPSACSAARRR